MSEQPTSPLPMFRQLEPVILTDGDGLWVESIHQIEALVDGQWVPQPAVTGEYIYPADD